MILVDRNVDRAREMARIFGISRVVADYDEIVDRVDGAVVAVPHKYHYGIALDCIKRGLHVLCEKPLAERAEQGEELVTEARKAGVAIALNNTRRLYPYAQRLKSMIVAGELGEIRSLDWEEGEPFGWPCASASFFGTAADSRGVITDKGAHVLDLICWWLGARPELVDYADDSLGGTEAVAEMSLVHGAVTGRVKLSWFSKLRNTFRVVGSAASVEGRIYDWSTLFVTPVGGRRRLLQLKDPTAGDFAKPLVQNFLQVISEGAAPLVSGADVLPSLELIDECYARRTPFAMPWNDTFARVTENV